MAVKKNTEKKTRTVKKKEEKVSSLSEFPIVTLKAYLDVCENILKRYENEVYANKNTDESAYNTAKDNYDKYVKIYNVLSAEIERRLSSIELLGIC